MSIPEMAEIKRKDIPYEVRLKMAIRNRALKEAAKDVGHPTSVESFNNSDLRREPDSLGITIYYPNKVNPTHVATKVFSAGVTDKEFKKQIKIMEKELLKKVPK